MFWTDWKAGVVESSDLDGSRRSVLASDLMWPNALAIDPPHQRVYWMEASTDTLESVKYDGTDRRVCDCFSGITLEKNFVPYFVHFDQESTSKLELVVGGLPSPAGVVQLTCAITYVYVFTEKEILCVA